jgi:hypothetical protein
MNPAYAVNWYPFKQICEIVGRSPRTVRTKLAAAREQLVRDEPVALGRPRKLYHFSVLPQLAAHHALNVERKGDLQVVPSDLCFPSLPSVNSGSSSALVCSSTPAPASGPAADDLAVAELRLQAVKQFEAIPVNIASRERAAALICDQWQRHPQVRHVRLVERLHEYQRKTQQTVSLGGFAPNTLRAWAALYRKGIEAGRSEAQILLDLAPERKGHSGRKGHQIPDAIVDFILLMAGSTARADVTKAVERARLSGEIPAEFQTVSLTTWRRRIRARDPRRAAADLMHSVSKYRANHTPDVEPDWESLSYNGRWELDDVQKDWYGLGTELQTVLRPWGYAIIRTRTRQWVAFAASETEPTHLQVRELLGFAMASPAGGIPDQAKFERGLVACPKDLQDLLETLGVNVSRTSMDGGAAITGLVEDRAKGHFQGKGVVEANFRRNHEIEWDKAGQVGPDERRTAPARTEHLKRLAVEAAKRGEPGLILPRPDQWYPVFLETMEKHNNTPHSALPEILDATGTRRHMTPNEMAQTLKDEPIRLMDPRLLPRFAAQAFEVDVTRNGFILNDHSYGRFEEDLQKFARVTVFASRDYPLVAYVMELGRCVDIYEKCPIGDSEQFAAKRRMESHFRNEHDALAARCISGGKPGIFDMLLMARNPTPDRQVAATVCPPELLTQATGLETGIAASKARQETKDQRFVASGASEAPRSERRSGLLAKAADLEAQVDMLSNPKGRDTSCPEGDTP